MRVSLYPCTISLHIAATMWFCQRQLAGLSTDCRRCCLASRTSYQWRGADNHATWPASFMVASNLSISSSTTSDVTSSGAAIICADAMPFSPFRNVRPLTEYSALTPSPPPVATAPSRGALHGWRNLRTGPLRYDCLPAAAMPGVPVFRVLCAQVRQLCWRVTAGCDKCQRRRTTCTDTMMDHR